MLRRPCHRLQAGTKSNPIVGKEIAMQEFVYRQLQELPKTKQVLSSLSPREYEIAWLATINSLSCKEIATRLDVSVKTIRHHMQKISRKARQVFGPHLTFRDAVRRFHCFYLRTH